MEKILYSPNDGWGMTYIFKKGYKKVESNMDKIETPGDSADDWIARFYYKDDRGNTFLKPKRGRTLKIDVNSKIDFYSDSYMVSIFEEIKNMENSKIELQHVYSALEKIVENTDSHKP